MDIIKFLRDFGVDHLTEGNKHCAKEWVQVHCPFCSGSQNWHLGWNIQEEYWNCYRCSWHPTLKTFSALTNMPEWEIKSILPSYGINRTILYKKEIVKEPFEFPTGTGKLSESHLQYLIKRGFNPDKLVKLWDIRGTGPMSKLDQIPYKFRILIPFYWNGEIVSFDSRDITDKQQEKYMACSEKRETMGHKQILYGNQEYWTDTGICVEGPTDVWRLGVHSFATSGIKYTPAQVRIMATTFKKIAVMFDDEPQAQIQAKKLIADLKFRGVDSWNVKIKGDPGSLPDYEAKQLIKSIIK